MASGRIQQKFCKNTLLFKKTVIVYIYTEYIFTGVLCLLI